MRDARKLAVIFASSLPASYLLWIIFVGTFSLHELLVGVIATALFVAGMVVVNMEFPARFSPRPSELLTCWRLPWYLLSGTWEIMVVAAKDALGIEPAQSLFRVSPFEAGDEEDPRASARRTLAVLYTTVAPNFIVLGVNSSDQKMLFHQIKRSSVPKMTQRLGAKA